MFDSLSYAECIVQSSAKAEATHQQRELAELRRCFPELQTVRVPPPQHREETVSPNIKIIFYQKYFKDAHVIWHDSLKTL